MFVVRCMLFVGMLIVVAVVVVRCLWFNVCCMLSCFRRSLFVVCCLLFVGAVVVRRCFSCVVCCMLFVV